MRRITAVEDKQVDFVDRIWQFRFNRKMQRFYLICWCDEEDVEGNVVGGLEEGISC